MANLIVRTPKTAEIAPPLDFSDPMELFRDWLRKPLVNQFAPLLADTGFAPAFEVRESPGGYTIKADVPGVLEKDIEVMLNGLRLVVNGKRMQEKMEEHETFFTCERAFGSFTRSFMLPDGIDPNGVHAELKDGVLLIGIPKVPQAKPKKIVVVTEPTKH